MSGNENTTDASPVGIEIWHATASSDQPGPVERLCQRYLNEEDRKRADKFRRPTTRNQHVVGRGMTRRLLGGEHVDPELWRYDDEPGGKPRLRIGSKEHRDALFNVSHTDGLVVCGVSQIFNGPQMLGVDVESVGRRIDLRMAERYFSQPEVRFVQSRKDEASARRAFLRIWTLKESFIKALGTGLRTPLADFAFESIDSPRPTIRFLDPILETQSHARIGCWHFESFEPRDGFIAAVAMLTGDPSATKVALRDFDQLA